MTKRKAYSLTYTATFLRHLKLLESKYHPLVRKTLENQLQYAPETANH
jgi:hypothetical protein